VILKKRMTYMVLELITPKINDLLGAKGVLTKGPIYAIERNKVLEKISFKKSNDLIIGKT